MKQQEQTPLAYSGKYIDYKSKTYFLAPERSQGGCMGYCYAEPTIEVKVPGKDPVVFGYVDTAKAIEIVDKYIVNGELLDGIIPTNYKTINDKN